jgi:hypothetical protein
MRKIFLRNRRLFGRTMGWAWILENGLQILENGLQILENGVLGE